MLTRRLLLAALALAPRVARGEGSALAPDMARIMARRQGLIIATAVDLPPYVVTAADGTLAGEDIALGRALAEALGVPYDFVQAETPDEILSLMSRGGADLAMARLSITLARAKTVRFSRPYLVLRHALLLNRHHLARAAPGIDPPAALNARDATVAVVADSGYADAARRLLPLATLRNFPRWQPDVVDAVRQGEVLAGYGDERQVEAALTATPDAPLQLRRFVLEGTRDAVAIALPWSSLQLLAWVDLFLESRPATDDGRDAGDQHNDR
ncbi:MAG TPA: transporter substrate-binding domain-containing protein [Stellaceae bacterium]|nr:transporter substrate-binding domain-containing protein [Stellaceae bacterium]